jgi:hypothetical protein
MLILAILLTLALPMVCMCTIPKFFHLKWIPTAYLKCSSKSHGTVIAHGAQGVPISAPYMARE